MKRNSLNGILIVFYRGMSNAKRGKHDQDLAFQVWFLPCLTSKKTFFITLLWNKQFHLPLPWNIERQLSWKYNKKVETKRNNLHSSLTMFSTTAYQRSTRFKREE
jgi:hypothetical protein